MDAHHPKQTLLRSGQLARLAGVSTDTLRHYERLGLIARPVRAVNGYRQYPLSTLERVLLIRRALTAGFTLAELASLLHSRDQGGIPCYQVRELAARKLEEAEERLRQLQQLRDDLCRLLSEWDARLEQTEPGAQARLLETLLQSRPAADSLPDSTAFGKRRRNAK